MFEDENLLSTSDQSLHSVFLDFNFSKRNNLDELEHIFSEAKHVRERLSVVKAFFLSKAVSTNQVISSS